MNWILEAIVLTLFFGVCYLYLAVFGDYPGEAIQGMREVMQ